MLSAEDGTATQSSPVWLTFTHPACGFPSPLCILFPQVWLFPHQHTDGADPGRGPDLHAARSNPSPIIPAGCNWLIAGKHLCYAKLRAAVKKAASPAASSCAPLLCRPLTGPGVHERSAYQLIPEFRGARAQWNFTDHLVKPQQFLNGFKAPLHLHYIRPTLLWPSCGSSRAVLEKSSSRSTSDNITIRDIHFHSCRASLRM